MAKHLVSILKTTIQNRIQLQGVLGITLGITIASVISIPYFNADRNYYLASSSRDAAKLIQAASAKPMVTERTIMGAKLLADSSLSQQSIELLDLTISVNPRNFNAWQLKYILSKDGSSEKTLSNQMRNELDPRLNYK